MLESAYGDPICSLVGGGGVKVRDGLKEIFTLICIFFRMHGRNLTELAMAVYIYASYIGVGNSKLFQLIFGPHHGTSMGMMGWTHESLKKYVIIAKHNYV